MTAINVIRQASAVHVLSDGVFCDPDGVVCEIGPNAFELPHLPAVLAIRGPTHFMPFLVHRLARECRCFDDLIRRVVAAALEVYASFPMTLGTVGFGAVEPGFELVVAGWSTKRNKPESYLVAGVEPEFRQGRKRKAWELLELPEVLIAPRIGDAQIGSIRWTVPESAETFQPEVDGLKLLEAQRRLRGASDGHPQRGLAHRIGGFIQLATISPDGIVSRILQRWPDEVGRKIEPGGTG